jgi:hypothetical protein
MNGGKQQSLAQRQRLKQRRQGRRRGKMVMPSALLAPLRAFYLAPVLHLVAVLGPFQMATKM